MNGWPELPWHLEPEHIGVPPPELIHKAGADGAGRFQYARSAGLRKRTEACESDSIDKQIRSDRVGRLWELGCARSLNRSSLAHIGNIRGDDIEGAIQTRGRSVPGFGHQLSFIDSDNGKLDQPFALGWVRLSDGYMLGIGWLYGREMLAEVQRNNTQYVESRHCWFIPHEFLRPYASFKKLFTVARTPQVSALEDDPFESE